MYYAVSRSILLLADFGLENLICGPFVFKVEMKRLNDEIKVKNEQISLLENQIANSIMAAHDRIDNLEVSQVSLASIMVHQTAWL